ncbi:MAG TPA: CDP-glucose 4,6-dehydratase [Acetobacteraceae bacterium]|nr:CDP-glucose 4,6-dehydratase [Acetobacteraceae bacterium]
MLLSRPDPSFWRGKRVLVTGHTGFKGGWAALWLQQLGADVSGLALPPEPLSLFWLAHLDGPVHSHLVDLRDASAVTEVVRAVQPQIVLHLAAQALLPRALVEPAETFAVNVTGTVNLLAALSGIEPLAAVLVITSDKVYAASEVPHAHVESDPLGGGDPYSASKAACELATAAMAQSFLRPRGVVVATARAGNVIGGGDFAPRRLVPDVVRAARDDTALELRDPNATRPWQHVLDCVAGYLTYLQALTSVPDVPTALNFGPRGATRRTAGDLAVAVQQALGVTRSWRQQPDPALPEAHALAIDSTLARRWLGWTDRLTGAPMIEQTAAWYRAWSEGADMRAVTLRQIRNYEALA